MRRVIKVSGIYKITNNITGKVYIGQSRDVFSRWQSHILHSILNNYTIGPRDKIHKAIREDGVENFSFTVLERCLTKSILDEREEYYINRCDSLNEDKGYNIIQAPGTTKRNINKWPRDSRYKYLKKCMLEGIELSEEEKDCPEYQGILEWRNKHADKQFPEYYSQLLLGLGRKAQRELTKKGYEKEKLVLELHERFKEGEWYLVSEVKQSIQEIFDSLQIKGKAKATTLAEFAEIDKRVRQSRDVDKGFYIRVLSWKG